MKAKLKTSKKVLIIVCSVMVLLGTFWTFIDNIAENEMSAIHSSMYSTLSTFVNKSRRSEGLQEVSGIMEKYQFNTVEFLIESAFKEADDVQTALEILDQDETNCWLIDSSGKIHAGRSDSEFDLTQTQYDQLLKEKCITTTKDGIAGQYLCFQLPQGTLIIYFEGTTEIGKNSLLTGISNRFDYYIASASDETIFESSNEALINSLFPNSFVPSAVGIRDYERRTDSNYKYGFTNLSVGRAYCMTVECNGYLYGLYYRYADIIKDVLSEMIPLIALLAGTFAVVLIFFFMLQKESDSEDESWIRILKTKYYFEKNKVTHLTGFTVFALIVSILFTAHFYQLSSYSRQSALATSNLDMLTENTAACDKDKEIFVDTIKRYNRIVSGQLAGTIKFNSDLCTHEYLETWAENCYLNEISVYDKDGMLEASSGDYYGYELTTNENDPMYDVRKVLTDDRDCVFINNDEETGQFVFARRRKDKPGIICIKFESPLLSKPLQYYSKYEAIRDTDFGNATTFFVNIEDENTTYVIEPYDATIGITQVAVPEELRQDKYSGITTIGGKESYVNTRNNGDIVIVSAIDCHTINRKIIGVLGALLVCFVALMFILFIGCARRFDNEEVIYEQKSENGPDEAATNEVNNLINDSCFRRMIKCELVVLVATYCIMMFKTVVGKQTILEFIFGGVWDKGINIFSINASIIVAVLTAVAVFIIKRLILFIGKSIGAKGMTICSIAASLLSFLGLFFAILHALYQFGINTTALMASAGIAGLVIGIASKDICADLIAGLFLIFEGNIKVGDFISFKDFRGEVSEIGARVTVLKRYNRRLVVNNSDLKQYYRLSDEPGAAFIEIDVDINEDVDRIADLITGSSEWYRSKIPTILDGPWFLNVSTFNASYMTVCMLAVCEDERSGSVKRKLLRYTMELFRENGIKFGSNSMKIEVDQNE